MIVNKIFFEIQDKDDVGSKEDEEGEEDQVCFIFFSTEMKINFEMKPFMFWTF